MKKHIISLIFIFLLSLPAVRPLMQEGFFPMHDDTQVARVVVMGKAIRNGQFPVRWVSDLGYGYGYPIFNFYGPLPYYVGGVLYALGVPGLIATKLMIAIGMIAAGLIFYVAFFSIVGSIGAITGALVYEYASYHAVELYVRGAIGEMWVLLFFPLILLGFYLLLSELPHRKRGIFFGGLGICGVLLCHTILGFTTVFFSSISIGIFSLLTLIRRGEKRRIVDMGLMLGMGLGLSAFFWFPALTEMKYTAVAGQIGPTANVLDHFVCLNQFFYSPWGYGGSSPGCEDGVSFALGKISLLLLPLGVFTTIFSWRKKNIRFIGSVGILISFGSIFFMIDWSTVFWNILPYFPFVQYPWRFLVYTMMGIALLSVVLIGSIKNRWGKIVLSVVITFLILLVQSKLFVPQYSYNRSLSSFETDEEIQFRVSHISDEYLPSSIIRPKIFSEVPKKLIPDSDVYVSKMVIETETYKKVEFEAKEKTKIILNHADFPGWVYWVNGQVQHIELDHGRPVITIPNEFSTLQMRFTNTIPRTLGNVLSLSVVVLLIYFYGKKTIS